MCRPSVDQSWCLSKPGTEKPLLGHPPSPSTIETIGDACEWLQQGGHSSMPPSSVWGSSWSCYRCLQSMAMRLPCCLAADMVAAGRIHGSRLQTGESGLRLV
ncbi:hypothetical protein QJQ45_024523 [Haematococcus lacustris]|nr:hypothetical protein QJQ45_024523 [Haematococcus lacustris]